MIHISLKNTYNKAITHHTKWHIGEPTTWEHSDVIELQADEDELVNILYYIDSEKLQNIPVIYNRNSVTWFGDDAKFISKNIL